MSLFAGFRDSTIGGCGLGGFGFRASILGVVASLSVGFVLVCNQAHININSCSLQNLAKNKMDLRDTRSTKR